MKNIAKKILRIFVIFLAIWLLLFAIGWGLIQTPYVQTKLVEKVVERLNDDYGTAIAVDRVEVGLDFRLNGDVNLYDVSAKDHKGLAFIKIPRLQAKVNLWDIYQNSSDLQLNDVILHQAEVEVITYEGEEEDNFMRFVNQFDDGEKSKEPPKFKMYGDFEFIDSKLSIVNQNLSPQEQLWLDARRMNGKVQKFTLDGRDYSAHLHQLSFYTSKQNEAYHLKELSLDFEMNPTQMNFENLRFTTEDSDWEGEVRMSYDSLAQFSNFSNEIQLDFTIDKGGKIAYKDIRYFSPDWDKNHIIEVQTQASGTLNDLFLNNVNLKINQVQIASERLQLQDFVAGNYAVFTQNVSVKASYDALQENLPAFLAAKIPNEVGRFGMVNYQGKLNYTPKDLEADGRLNTSIGTVVVAGSLRDHSADVPTYNGKIQSNGFDLQKLLNDPDFGVFKGDIAFSGEGFDLNTLDLQLKGTVEEFTYDQQKYTGISVDGNLKDEKYVGFIGLNDRRVRATYNGIIDFSEPNLYFNFDSNIKHLDLYELGLTKKKNTYLTARVVAETSFRTLNDLQGDFMLEDIHFVSDTIDVVLPSALVRTHKQENKQNKLILEIPNELDLSLQGSYVLDELPEVFANEIGNFLTDYTPKKVSPNQKFSYSIRIKGNKIRDFIPTLSVSPGTYLAGEVDTSANRFELDLYAQQFAYQDFTIDSLQLIASSGERKNFALTAQTLSQNDFKIRNLTLYGKPLNDTLIANATFDMPKGVDGNVFLNFYQTYNAQNQMKIGFSPSQINIEDQTWNINPLNVQDANYALLDFEQGYYELNQISLDSEGQKIVFEGHYANDKDYDFDAKIKNVLLEKSIPKFLIGKETALKGTINGTLQVNRTQDELQPTAELHVDNIYFNDYLVGNFTTNASYDEILDSFEIRGSLDRENLNTLFLVGQINNSGNEPKMDFDVNLDAFNMNFLNVFLADFIDQWRGSVSGNMNLTGTFDSPQIDGFLQMNDLGFRVVYLGTEYEFSGENDLLINKPGDADGFIQLNDLDFREVATDTHANVDGLLIFSDLSTWFMSLDFETDKLMMLNTTIRDNELVYGNLYGQGEFRLFGPATDLEVSGKDLNIVGDSFINLNSGSTKSAGDTNFIQFYSRDSNGEVLETEGAELASSGITLDLELNVDESTLVNLVLDERTNDKLSARGHAEDFKIKMNKSGDLDIVGEYVIDGGNYTYKYGVIFNKDFALQKDGYIRFSGDPYNANVNLRATYNTVASNTLAYLGTGYSDATEVDVHIDMLGDLNDLKFEMGLDLPNASSQMQNQLRARLNNEDEITKQVSSIIATRSFNTQDNLAGQNLAQNAAEASALELVSKQIGNLLTNLIPNLAITPSWVQASQSGNFSNRFQTDVNYKFSPRLSINGSVGTPLGSEQNEQVTTEVEIDYDISKKRNNGLVIRGFSRPTTLGVENFNINSTFAQSYGVGIVYRRSFNSLKEFLGFSLLKGKKKNKDETPEEKEQSAVQDSAVVVPENKKASAVEFYTESE